jgi:hypothetical protein
MKVGARPYEVIRFAQDDPGAFAVKAKTFLCHRRYLKGISCVAGRRVRHREDAHGGVPAIA